MFTIFLTATALAAVLVLAGLLLRPKRDAQRLALPYSGIIVAAISLALVTLGLWMV